MAFVSRIGVGLCLVVLLSLVSCASPAPRSEPTGAAPSAAAQPSAWDALLEAARREGSVAIVGPIGDERRSVLTEPFERKYGIRVDYKGDAGPGIGPMVSAEREAGQFMWDVFVGGTTTAFAALIPLNALKPLEPELTLPEVRDPQSWRGGAPEFVDDAHEVLAFLPSHRGILFVNNSQVRDGEITSLRDLLDPRWRGKLALHDPRIAGPGQATFTFFYLHPDLGPAFIRGLAEQQPVVLRDTLQLVDAVGQGRYPVVVGTAETIVEERIRQGVPIRIVEPRELKEGTDVSSSAGNVGLFSNSPHPDAAKVYLNWLLTREAQTEIARVYSAISSRADVPTDHSPWRVPQLGAIRTHSREAFDLRNQLVPVLEEVFGR
jgi:iron(III) transport system substrate-binding protein